MMDIRIDQTAQILYQSLNGNGYARRLSTASPTERRRYMNAAEKVLTAILDGVL